MTPKHRTSYCSSRRTNTTVLVAFDELFWSNVFFESLKSYFCLIVDSRANKFDHTQTSETLLLIAKDKYYCTCCF